MIAQQENTTTTTTTTTPTSNDTSDYTTSSRDVVEYKSVATLGKEQQLMETVMNNATTTHTTNNNTQQEQEIKPTKTECNQKDNKTPNKSESLEKPMSMKEFLKITILPRWFSVPNKVSEARDMLATERTMLTWYRTAFSILGVGIAVSRMKKSDGSVIPKVVGAISCSLAMILIMYAHLRYYVVMKSLFEYHFSADTLSPPFILLIGILICVIAVLLFFV